MTNSLDISNIVTVCSGAHTIAISFQRALVLDNNRKTAEGSESGDALLAR